MTRRFKLFSSSMSEQFLISFLEADIILIFIQKVAGSHAEHSGMPYCHVPCYAALFGPKGFGRGRTESHVYKFQWNDEINIFKNELNKTSFKICLYLKNLKLFVYPPDSGPFAGKFLKSPLNQRFFRRALIHCIKKFYNFENIDPLSKPHMARYQ